MLELFGIAVSRRLCRKASNWLPQKRQRKAEVDEVPGEIQGIGGTNHVEFGSADVLQKVKRSGPLGNRRLKEE